MTDKTPAKLAADASEAIRALNHATLGWNQGSEDWRYPGDAYSVTGNLAHGAMMLPQAIDQVRGLVERLYASENLGSDKGALETGVAEAFGGLDDAKAAAEALYAALNRAHAGLSSLAYRG